jgi:hypothetical protein
MKDKLMVAYYNTYYLISSIKKTILESKHTASFSFMPLASPTFTLMNGSCMLYSSYPVHVLHSDTSVQSRASPAGLNINTQLQEAIVVNTFQYKLVDCIGAYIIALLGITLQVFLSTLRLTWHCRHLDILLHLATSCQWTRVS